MVKDMHQELKSWGHPGGGRNALILNSDGEPAIVAMREALSRGHGGRVTPEQPPRGEHQANELAEEAGRTVRAQAWVLKLHLESSIGRAVDQGEPIMPWLIRWAPMSVSRFLVGKDRKTHAIIKRGRSAILEWFHSARRWCLGIHIQK